MSEKVAESSIQRTIFLSLLFIVSITLILISLILPILRSYLTPAIEAGQVATRDYRTTQSITFESQVLTEQRREIAERNITPIYSSPNTSIARQQLERLRTALTYISSVRADAYASTTQKMEDLAALHDIDLSQETATTILGITDSRWQTIQQETIEVLENVMSGAIRAETMQSVRERVPLFVSLSLSEDQAAIVAELASAFVVPNSEYSESATKAAQQEARDAVIPVTRTFVTGQKIISQGEVLTESDIEVLQKLGLVQPEQRWQDLVSAVALSLLLVTFMLFYIHHRQPSLKQDLRSLTLLSVLFLVFLLSARLVIPTHIVIPYAFPFAAYSLAVAALFGVEIALISSLPLAIMTAFSLSNALDLTLYYLVGSLFGVLALGRAQRVLVFFWAGAAIAVAGAITVVIYRLPLPATDTLGLATLVGASALNGLASSSIAILLQFILAQLLGLTTPIQLMDLTRPDNPMLQSLLREAPGTYQHSLQVANLAEQAAERTGADPLLTRVGALYHDIGKTINPIFFIENQPPGFRNPHEDLDPKESSQIIIRHVTEGLDLAHKNRLPRRIHDFIAEHHGTLLTRFQYITAVKASGGNEDQVNMEEFRYPGPRPQSRETAILLLADGCEARVRAERPDNDEELEQIIKSTIDNRVAQGQLDDTQLTLSDLNIIFESFTATLRGIYHPRVKYPQLEETSPADSATRPLVKQSDSPTDLTMDSSTQL